MADCQVCGTPVELPAPVTCELCETPHHEDCWRYLGSCSTYACLGLKIAPVEQVTAVSRPIPDLDVFGSKPATWRARPGVIQWNTYAPEPSLTEGATALRISYAQLPGHRELNGLLPIGPRPFERDEAYLAIACAGLLGLLVVAGASPVVALALGVPATLAARARRAPMWLVHDPARGRYSFVKNGVALIGQSSSQIEPPVRIALTRNLSMGMLAYFLLIEWSAITASPLCEPITIPDGDSDEERRRFLDRLLAARTLGPRIAATLGLRYTEQLLAKKHR